MVLGDKAKDKVLKYVPHGINNKTFYPINEFMSKESEDINKKKKDIFGDFNPEFVVFYNARNIRRKSTSDLIAAYSLFCDKIGKEKAGKCALLLHTQVADENGTDLNVVKDLLCDPSYQKVYFSDARVPPYDVNLLYNMSDVTCLISSNEGWGLSLTESMMTGRMIIGNVSGGMQDQMRFEDENGNWFTPTPEIPSNHKGTYKKHGEWAFPVFPSTRVLQGSPPTPYIWDDVVKAEDAAEQIMNVYKLTPEERKARGLKGREWAIGEEAGFTGETQGKRVIEALDELFLTWEPREKFEFINVNKVEDRIVKHELLY